MQMHISRVAQDVSAGKDRRVRNRIHLFSRNQGEMRILTALITKQDGETVLVEYTTTLSNAISSLLNDRDELKTLIEAGREVAMKDWFDTAKQAALTLRYIVQSRPLQPRIDRELTEHIITVGSGNDLEP